MVTLEYTPTNYETDYIIIRTDPFFMELFEFYRKECGITSAKVVMGYYKQIKEHEKQIKHKVFAPKTE